jgi:hypothetical protein
VRVAHLLAETVRGPTDSSQPPAFRAYLRPPPKARTTTSALTLTNNCSIMKYNTPADRNRLASTESDHPAGAAAHQMAAVTAPGGGRDRTRRRP